MGVGLEDGPQCKAGTWDPRETSALSGPGVGGGRPAREGRCSSSLAAQEVAVPGGQTQDSRRKTQLSWS